jgi:hypothetical protein
MEKEKIESSQYITINKETKKTLTWARDAWQKRRVDNREKRLRGNKSTNQPNKHVTTIGKVRHAVDLSAGTAGTNNNKSINNTSTLNFVPTVHLSQPSTMTLLLPSTLTYLTLVYAPVLWPLADCSCKWSKAVLHYPFSRYE